MVKNGNSEKVRKEIQKFLNLNEVLTLAVSDKNQPWVCTLYYGIDKEMNFYTVTDDNSVHGKILSKNGKVAFNIFDSHQKITKPKKGVQGKGICTKVKGVVEVTKGLFLWHKANPGIEKNITVADILKKLSDTKLYKITPTYLKFFNKVLYGSEEYGELFLR